MRTKNIDGIVIKVTKNNIVLLCENGRFKNVPLTLTDQIPMLGQHFSYAEKRQLNLNLIKYLSIASVLILTILAFTFIPLGDKDSAYIVAMDINPSIEIRLDKNLLVQEISGLNSDGKDLIEYMQVSNQHLFEVTEIVIKAAKEKGYFQSEEALVSITVISLNEDLKPLELDIEEGLNQSFKDNSINSALTVSLGSKELYQEARELNVSVNKIILYKELYAQGVVQSPQDVREKTILQLREMRKIIDGLQNKDEDNENSNLGERLRDIPALPDQDRDNNRLKDKEQDGERAINQDRQDRLNDSEEEEQKGPASRQETDSGEDEDLPNDMAREGTSPPTSKRIR